MADFMGMMKQAAQLQSKMQEMQAELDRTEVEGTAGGGMVTVKLSAKGDMKGVKIDDSLIKPSEKEILEDLLVAAHADARVHRASTESGKKGHAGASKRFGSVCTPMSGTVTDPMVTEPMRGARSTGSPS